MNYILQRYGSKSEPKAGKCAPRNVEIKLFAKTVENEESSIILVLKV
jgi:hypothetical protein